MATASDLIGEWRARGPIAWAEGAYGWIGDNGQPITLTPWQRAALLAWWERRETISTLAISNVKKTGKTLCNAVLLAWRWLAMPGEHFAIGNDLDQSAGRQFQQISEMVKRNPYLRANVKAGKTQLVFEPTSSTLTALAVDAAGNAGANHLTASHTEAWGIQYEGGIRAFEELTPPPGRSYGLPALRICDSYAGFLAESETWHGIVDRGLLGERVSDDWPIFQSGGLLLFHMEGTEAQARCFRGTQPEAAAYYAEQRASLRENAFARLHLNTRTQNAGTFCTPEEWAACIDPAHVPLPPGAPYQVLVGLDLAVSAGGDNAAVIGVYGEGGRVKVAWHKVWKGSERAEKLKLSQTVEPYLVARSTEYNLGGIYFDPWQCVYLAERLGTLGISTREVTQSHATRGPKDTALLDLARMGRLVLYDHPDLRNAASGANARELPNGQIYLQKAGGRSKIDLLVALSNVANEVEKNRLQIWL